MRSLHSTFGRFTPGRVLTVGTLLVAFGCGQGDGAPGVVSAPKNTGEPIKPGPPPKRKAKVTGQQPTGTE
jgi:hypothetical protein